MTARHLSTSKYNSVGNEIFDEEDEISTDDCNILVVKKMQRINFE